MEVQVEQRSLDLRYWYGNPKTGKEGRREKGGFQYNLDSTSSFVPTMMGDFFRRAPSVCYTGIGETRRGTPAKDCKGGEHNIVLKTDVSVVNTFLECRVW